MLMDGRVILDKSLFIDSDEDGVDDGSDFFLDVNICDKPDYSNFDFSLNSLVKAIR